MLSHILRELLLPPASLFLALAMAWGLRRRFPRQARWLAAGTLLLFYLLSIPLVSFRLTRWTEKIPAASMSQIAQFQPEVIVVVGGGARVGAVEYEGRTVPSLHSWPRVAYAAYLAKRLGLPILACGGMGNIPEQSEGYAMAATLKEWGVPEVWIEGRSRDTWENARFGKEQLDGKGIRRVLLVTNAQHAPRAQTSFRAAGLEVLSAPTEFREWGPWERGLLLIIPSHRAFDESSYALRTVMGELWYSLRS